MNYYTNKEQHKFGRLLEKRFQAVFQLPTSMWKLVCLEKLCAALSKVCMLWIFFCIDNKKYSFSCMKESDKSNALLGQTHS